MVSARGARELLAVAAIVAVVLTTASCGSEDSSTARLAGVVRTPALDVGDVELPDVSGRSEVSTPMRAPDDELVLVYFGYTSCPDICPTTMSDIRAAVRELPAELAERVTVAMATVDPDRDTPEVLNGYLGHFFDRTMALRTEDPSALAAAAEAFGVRYEVADHEPGAAAYEVSHSAVTYVVDDTGSVVVEWPFGFDSDDVTADLTTLLDEESP